jgi:hypothetical protein
MAMGVFLGNAPRALAEGEDDLKSATLMAFVQNTQWPERLAAGAPFTIGVLGRPDFALLLRRNLETKSVDGHPLRILELQSPPDVHGCQLLYFATDRVAEIKDWLDTLHAAHVLTLGETSRFLQYGGAVNLYLVDGHMGFEVSLDALGHAGIVISSKLLRFGQLRDLAQRRQAK